ncbi:hypothetical protein A4R29_04775 [Mesorhizobium ciceri biovar biserrulae]|nr:hypothetical protein A4R29_04775 [Mesorhizobium ciceri biovar biserrulae]
MKIMEGACGIPSSETAYALRQLALDMPGLIDPALFAVLSDLRTRDACPNLTAGRKHVGMETTVLLALFDLSKPIKRLQRARRAGTAFAR